MSIDQAMKLLEQARLEAIDIEARAQTAMYQGERYLGALAGNGLRLLYEKASAHRVALDNALRADDALQVAAAEADIDVDDK
jgi:hypothetical protein